MPCWLVFPLAPALGSISSADGLPSLFADFPATMAGSDFSGPCITGFGLPAFPMRTAPRGAAEPEISRFPCRKCRRRARVSDHAGPTGHWRWRAPPCCLPLHRKRRHPGLIPLRGSIPGPSPPLSTLRPGPRGPTRMTRGRCGSLYLHRTGLAPAASCRSPGAPVLESLRCRKPNDPCGRCRRAAPTAVIVRPVGHADRRAQDNAGFIDVPASLRQSRNPRRIAKPRRGDFLPHCLKCGKSS